jgi:hypothetical protein
LWHEDASTPPVGTIGKGFTWCTDVFREWWAKNKRDVAFVPGAATVKAEADDCLVAIRDAEAVAYLSHEVPQHFSDKHHVVGLQARRRFARLALGRLGQGRLRVGG